MNYDKFKAQFEEQGVDTVRARLIEWSGEVKGAAMSWLADMDLEGRKRAEDKQKRSDAQQSEQMRVALSANRAAWIAAGASIIAAIFAAISIVVELKQ